MIGKYKNAVGKIKKERYYGERCKELEDLDAKNCPKLYQKIKEMQPKAPRTNLGVKDKQGNILQTEHEVLARWKEYISELYTDNRLEQYWPIENETIKRINEQEVENNN